MTVPVRRQRSCLLRLRGIEVGSVKQKKRPSLESLVENEDLGIEILHPGGLDITGELAELCHIRKGSEVLDVASGTGESACFLVQKFGCRAVGVDVSDYMVNRAAQKARERGLLIDFKRGDAHNLPFEGDTFDVAISECTTCLLDKDRAISEMVRVVKPGGYVGIHDICWKEDTPGAIKRRLIELEGERPETLEGWKGLFAKAGLEEIVTVDKSFLIPGWEKEVRKKIGAVKQLKIFLKVIKSWGFGGVKAVIESEKIFQGPHTGYGIIVGRKP